MRSDHMALGSRLTAQEPRSVLEQKSDLSGRRNLQGWRPRRRQLSGRSHRLRGRVAWLSGHAHRSRAWHAAKPERWVAAEPEPTGPIGLEPPVLWRGVPLCVSPIGRPDRAPWRRSKRLHGVDDLGKNGRIWPEADFDGTDLETAIVDLLSGQYKNPIMVISFNTAERWSPDVSVNVAKRCACVAICS